MLVLVKAPGKVLLETISEYQLLEITSLKILFTYSTHSRTIPQQTGYVAEQPSFTRSYCTN